MAERQVHMDGFSVKKMVLDAAEKNEWILLFTGKPPYEMDTRRLPCKTPTDWESILNAGVYPLLKSKSGEFRQSLHSAMALMIDNDAFHVWCAYNIYFYETYIVRLQNKRKIFDQSLRERLQNALMNKKKILASQKANGTMSMWEDISHMDSILGKKFKGALL